MRAQQLSAGLVAGLMGVSGAGVGGGGALSPTRLAGDLDATKVQWGTRCSYRSRAACREVPSATAMRPQALRLPKGFAGDTHIARTA